mgnify:CR=1 FL=1
MTRLLDINNAKILNLKKIQSNNQEKQDKLMQQIVVKESLFNDLMQKFKKSIDDNVKLEMMEKMALE